MKRAFLAVVLALSFVLTTAMPASASEWVPTQSNWFHAGVTSFSTTFVENSGGDVRAGIKFRRQSGVSPCCIDIQINAIRLFRDGVRVGNNTNITVHRVGTTWQYRHGNWTAPTQQGCYGYVAEVVFRFFHTSDGHSTGLRTVRTARAGLCT